MSSNAVVPVGDAGMEQTGEVSLLGLRQMRQQRGWTQARLIAGLREVASREGVELPPTNSMRIMVSRWENGHVQPEQDYRRYLEAVFAPSLVTGVAKEPALTTSAALETGSDPRFLEPVGQLLESPLCVGAVHPDLLAHFRGLLDSYITADVRWGSGLVFTGVKSLANTMDEVLTGHGLHVDRSGLEIGFHVAEFYGWVLQDVGKVEQAQSWSDKALEYAKRLQDPFRLAYILMRKSSIASDAGQHLLAQDLAENALNQDISLAPRLRAVVLRQQAIAYSGSDRPLLAMRSLDKAWELVDAAGKNKNEADSFCLYCTPAYIASEAGAAWLQLGYPQRAQELLTSAYRLWGQVDRDRVYMLSRLARAHALYGDDDAGAQLFIQAKEAAAGVYSSRVQSDLRTTLQTLNRRIDVNQ